MPSHRSRKWVVTAFRVNDVDIDEKSTLEWERLRSSLRYLSYQVERCPTSDRLHLQIYLESKKQIGLRAVQNLLAAPEAHCEIAYNPNAADAYCHKEESRVAGPYEHGERSVCSGDRTDLKTAISCVSEFGMRDCAELFPESFVRYHRGLRELVNVKRGVPRTQPPFVVTITGPPGTGKTSWVYNTYGADNIFNVQFVNGFFVGYENQPVALFDDFDPSTVKYNYLLQLLDRYPLVVNVKGSQMTWNPEVIVITNNQTLDTWYPGVCTDALYRRVHQVVEIIDGTYKNVRERYLPTEATLVPIDVGLPTLATLVPIDDATSSSSLSISSSSSPYLSSSSSSNFSTSASDLEETLERCPQL